MLPKRANTECTWMMEEKLFSLAAVLVLTFIYTSKTILL